MTCCSVDCRLLQRPGSVQLLAVWSRYIPVNTRTRQLSTMWSWYCLQVTHHCSETVDHVVVVKTTSVYESYSHVRPSLHLSVWTTNHVTSTIWHPCVCCGGSYGLEPTADAHTSMGDSLLVQDGSKDTFPLYWLSPNCLGMSHPCNDSIMLQRVRHCPRYHYYHVRLSRCSCLRAPSSS